MAGLIDWAVRVLIIVYLAALLLLVADFQGWFGPATGPLARTLMERLGFPWNRMLDGAPIQLLPWLTLGAPIMNILLLNMLSNQFKR